MKANAEKTAEQALEYVLGALSEPQKSQFEATLNSDVTLQQKVNDWQNRLLPLTDALPPQNPSAHVSVRIERSLDALSALKKELNATNVQPWWTTAWLNLPLWRAAALASVLGFVALGVQMEFSQSLVVQPAQPIYMAVLVTPQDKAPGWVIQANHAKQIQLIPLGVMHVPAGKALQFWTKADSWSAPVSLGLVQSGQALTVMLDQLPPLQANQLFELTLEPEGGSPTGKPTGPIQSIGRGVAF